MRNRLTAKKLIVVYTEILSVSQKFYLSNTIVDI